jgi:RsiW-degrading membrane proteinase PrsW (M82 family)
MSVLVLEPFQGALAEGIALFLALAVVLVMFEAIGRARGWSEVNGLLDGVIYGAAVGLGFAAGSALVSNLRFGTIDELLGISAFDRFWTAVLAGLATGLVGAILGAGFGAALESRSRARQLAYPVVGLVVAVLFGWVYALLFDGTAGTPGLARVWVGLLIPVIAVAVVVLVALTREKNAISLTTRGGDRRRARLGR